MKTKEMLADIARKQEEIEKTIAVLKAEKLKAPSMQMNITAMLEYMAMARQYCMLRKAQVENE